MIRDMLKSYVNNTERERDPTITEKYEMLSQIGGV